MEPDTLYDELDSLISNYPSSGDNNLDFQPNNNKYVPNKTLNERLRTHVNNGAEKRKLEDDNDVSSKTLKLENNSDGQLAALLDMPSDPFKDSQQNNDNLDTYKPPSQSPGILQKVLMAEKPRNNPQQFNEDMRMNGPPQAEMTGPNSKLQMSFRKLKEVARDQTLTHEKRQSELFRLVKEDPQVYRYLQNMRRQGMNNQLPIDQRPNQNSNMGLPFNEGDFPPDINGSQKDQQQQQWDMGFKNNSPNNGGPPPNAVCGPPNADGSYFQAMNGPMRGRNGQMYNGNGQMGNFNQQMMMGGPNGNQGNNNWMGKGPMVPPPNYPYRSGSPGFIRGPMTNDRSNMRMGGPVGNQMGYPPMGMPEFGGGRPGPQFNPRPNFANNESYQTRPNFNGPMNGYSNGPPPPNMDVGMHHPNMRMSFPSDGNNFNNSIYNNGSNNQAMMNGNGDFGMPGMMANPGMGSPHMGNPDFQRMMGPQSGTGNMRPQGFNSPGGGSIPNGPNSSPRVNMFGGNNQMMSNRYMNPNLPNQMAGQPQPASHLNNVQPPPYLNTTNPEENGNVEEQYEQQQQDDWKSTSGEIRKHLVQKLQAALTQQNDPNPQATAVSVEEDAFLTSTSLNVYQSKLVNFLATVFENSSSSDQKPDEAFDSSNSQSKLEEVKNEDDEDKKPSIVKTNPILADLLPDEKFPNPTNGGGIVSTSEPVKNESDGLGESSLIDTSVSALLDGQTMTTPSECPIKSPSSSSSETRSTSSSSPVSSATKMSSPSISTSSNSILNSKFSRPPSSNAEADPTKPGSSASPNHPNSSPIYSSNSTSLRPNTGVTAARRQSGKLGQSQGTTTIPMPNMGTNNPHSVDSGISSPRSNSSSTLYSPKIQGTSPSLATQASDSASTTTSSPDKAS